MKSWSSVAGIGPTQIEISNKKSYTLTKVFYGCSKKANQLIQYEGKPVEPVWSTGQFSGNNSQICLHTAISENS